MKTKKFTLTKKSKTLISLGAAVALLAGLGVTLGETLTHKNNTKWTDATGIGYTEIGNKAVQWGTYPTGNDIISWYNDLANSKDINLISFNNNGMVSFQGWQSFADAAKDPSYGFNIATMNLPSNFTPVQISLVTIHESGNYNTTATHYLAIDENYNIVDLVHVNDNTSDGHWQAGVKGLSDWTLNAISYFNYNPDFHYIKN